MYELYGLWKIRYFPWVTRQDLNPDWQMTWLNLQAPAGMGLVMKVFVLFLPGAAVARSGRFLGSPVLAPSSLTRSQSLRAAPAFFAHGSILGGLAEDGSVRGLGHTPLAAQAVRKIVASPLASVFQSKIDDSLGASPFPPYCTVVWVIQIKLGRVEPQMNADRR